MAQRPVEERIRELAERTTASDAKMAYLKLVMARQRIATGDVVQGEAILSQVAKDLSKYNSGA